MIRAASSNCHFVRLCMYGGRYTRRCDATRLDVCNVNGLSAYVLLTSSSGSSKHARVVRRAEICARHLQDVRSKGRRARSHLVYSTFTSESQFFEKMTKTRSRKRRADKCAFEICAWKKVEGKRSEIKR